MTNFADGMMLDLTSSSMDFLRSRSSSRDSSSVIMIDPFSCELLNPNRSSTAAMLSPRHQYVPKQTIIELHSVIEAAVQTFPHPVTIATIPSATCHLVITDAQWLKENLLDFLYFAEFASWAGEIAVEVGLDQPYLSTCGIFDRPMVRVTVIVFDLLLAEEDEALMIKSIKQQHQQAGYRPCFTQRIAALQGSYGISKYSEQAADGFERYGSSLWFTFPYQPIGDCLQATNAICPRNLQRLHNLSLQPSSDDESYTALPRDMSDPRANINVLMVDKCQMSIHIVSKVLRTNGFAVSTASSGADALSILEQEELQHFTQVVLVELDLPILSGIETIRLIRSLERARKGRMAGFVIIACSSSDDPAKILEAFDAGADDYIQKPFTFDLFQKKLNRLEGTRLNGLC